jgi:hypothetical protein
MSWREHWAANKLPSVKRADTLINTNPVPRLGAEFCFYRKADTEAAHAYTE